LTAYIWQSRERRDCFSSLKRAVLIVSMVRRHISTLKSSRTTPSSRVHVRAENGQKSKKSGKRSLPQRGRRLCSNEKPRVTWLCGMFKASYS
jgi:hypothetical protein